MRDLKKKSEKGGEGVFAPVQCVSYRRRCPICFFPVFSFERALVLPLAFEAVIVLESSSTLIGLFLLLAPPPLRGVGLGFTLGGM